MRNRPLIVIVALVLGAALVFEVWTRMRAVQAADPSFDAGVEHRTASHQLILFDAAHHNFHTAHGNYKPFADLLRNDGFSVAENEKPFTRDSLGRARVVVIANALGTKGVIAMLANLVGIPSALHWHMSAFTNEECDAVQQWVHDGGSLLLIADHAPTGNTARALSQRFGADMSNWFTEDEKHCDPRATSFIVYSRENGLLREHLVTHGLRQVVTFTGQSLTVPPGATPFLALSPSAREYPQRNSKESEGRSAAGRAQGVALEYGRGRVVILGEAAMLSAQVFAGGSLRLGMNYPGCDNRQLALNIAHWLARI